MKVLVINPGATSTKIAVFDEDKQVFKKGIDHSAQELDRFERVIDQADYRRQAILDAVAESGYRLSDFDAVCGRGGLYRPIPSGTYAVSDDGTWGEKGLVTDALKKLIDGGRQYDQVIAIGPLVMMKFVCRLTKEYGIKTVVSMNPIMIDGTGMCGCCRLSVGGKMMFACVDGPDFDGHQVDFDEAMARCAAYKPFEAKAREAACNLFSMEVK